MTYQPYLIANYSTGLNTRLQPWLIPDDAQETLFDGYVYRGTMSIREGYKYYAIGLKGGTPYRESRIVTSLFGPKTSPMVGVIDSANQTFTLNGKAPIAAGTITITGSTPLQVLNDDGVGGFTGDGIGTVNYVTGAISITFTTAPTGGTVIATYQNAQNMVGAIDSINQVFTYAGPVQLARGSVTVTGSTPSQTFTDDGLGQFFDGITPIGTVNYLTGAISITLPVAPTAGTVTVIYSSMPDDPVMMIATYINEVNTKRLVVASTKYINFYDGTTNVLVDITNVPYTGGSFDFFTWTNYASPTNTPRLLFCNNVDVIQQYDGTVVTDYVYSMETSTSIPVPVTSLLCSWMGEFKDRLVLLRTTENGVVYPQRIRISGTGANSDDFRITATGAGFIDIPDGSWIKGADFNRDDLLIFTENATWVLKYTGNDTTPFVIDRIDESRGCDATFSVITYLNRTSACSPRGLIVSDGYKVERQDDLIPNFSFNEIDGDNFELCFAGSVDIDRDHYLIYPPPEQEESQRILVTNYDEDNYAIYRLPLSCMGTGITSTDIDWNDLLVYNDWASFANDYGNWNSFGYSSGAPFAIGGGHHGEIWQISGIESEDNPVKIRAITAIDSETIQVTTDWNNYSLNENDQQKGADVIFFTGVQGMVEINNGQFPIIQVIDNNNFIVKVSTAVEPPKSAIDFGTYTPNTGQAARVIPFQATMKQFNPYVNQDKKVRCGWIYMYVNTTGSDLTRRIAISGITNANPCVITTQEDHNLSSTEQVDLSGIGGTVELNNTNATITVLSNTTFELNGVDSTSFGVYTSGGYAGAPVKAKIDIEVITNDSNAKTQLNNPADIPYQGNMTNMILETQQKKWYKVFINQTGKFIQFRFKNQQGGAQVNIQAIMPGFQPVGRMI